MNSRRTPLLAVPQWPGGHVGCFSMAVLAGSPIPMAPFLVWSSYVRRALRRTQSSLVPNRAVSVAERVCSITHLRLTPRNSQRKRHPKTTKASTAGRHRDKPSCGSAPGERDDTCGLKKASDRSFDISRSIVCIFLSLSLT